MSFIVDYSSLTACETVFFIWWAICISRCLSLLEIPYSWPSIRSSSNVLLTPFFFCRFTTVWSSTQSISFIFPFKAYFPLFFSFYFQYSLLSLPSIFSIPLSSDYSSLSMLLSGFLADSAADTTNTFEANLLSCSDTEVSSIIVVFKVMHQPEAFSSAYLRTHIFPLHHFQKESVQLQFRFLH